MQTLKNDKSDFFKKKIDFFSSEKVETNRA